MIAFAIDLSAQNVNPDLWSVTRAYRSTNGGRTWQDKGPVRYTSTRDDITQSGDPVALFDQDGMAYYASLASPSEGGTGIFVHRSHNAGATWQTPILAVAKVEDPDKDICTSTDKEWLTADPYSDKLYLTYTLFTFTCSGTGAPTDLYTRLTDIAVYMTTSDDRGNTWMKPNMIWDGYALGATPKVGPDGTLYVSFWGTVELPPTACPAPVGVVAAKGGGRPFASIITGSSKDAGKTWSYHQQPICDWIAGETLKPGRFVGGSFFPSLAVDPSTGAAHVAYPSFVPSEGRFTIELISSADAGASWSTPVEVTPGSEDARMPALFADRGILHLVYVETTGTRDQDGETSDGTVQTLYVESADGGSSWSPPNSLSSKVGHPKEFTELGDYIAVDITSGWIAAAWTDARDGSEAGEIWARVGSITQQPAREAGPPTVAGQASLSPALPWSLDAPEDDEGFFARPHRALTSTLIPSEGGPSCVREKDRHRLRRALAGGRSTRFSIGCSPSEAYHQVGKTAERLRYDVAFSDNEGFEAELLLVRGSYMILFKIIDSAAKPHGSDVVIKRFKN